MTIYFEDIEANGLLETITKIHCLSSVNLTGSPVTYTKDYSEHFLSLEDGDTLVYHNGFGYDYKAFRKLGFIDSWDVDNNLLVVQGVTKHIQHIDTLALSREWWPDKPDGHGLAAWAKRLKTFKPEITDWENLPIEVYIDRCENDAETTRKLFIFLCDKLGIDYERD